MILNIKRELIEKIFISDDYSDIEVEQEEVSKGINYSIQNKLKNFVLSIKQTKDFMKKNTYDSIDGSGFSIDIDSDIIIIYDFGMFNDDSNFSCDMRLTIKLDFNLNIINANLIEGFMGSKFVFKCEF